MPLFKSQPVFCSNCGKSFDGPVNRERWVTCSRDCRRELEWKHALFIMGEAYYPKPPPMYELIESVGDLVVLRVELGHECPELGQMIRIKDGDSVNLAVIKSDGVVVKTMSLDYAGDKATHLRYEVTHSGPYIKSREN